MARPGWKSPSAWLRATVVALAVVGALRLLAPALRPATRGMADDTCPSAEASLLDKALLSLRVLGGDRPYFDHWTALCFYAEENAAILREGRKVETAFIGDSITRNWLISDPAAFAGPQVNRGISGQSAAQVLARFQSDVVALKPRTVHLMIGTNDVAGLHGPSRPQDWQAAIRAMVDLAQANGIAVILATLPPMAVNPVDPDHRPAGVIREQNAWLAQFAAEKGLVLADYHAALADAGGGFRPGMSLDDIHPSERGYAAMKPVLESALAAVSAKAAAEGR